MVLTDTIYWEIFEDECLSQIKFRGWPSITTDYNGTSAFRVVKISRLQANPQKYIATYLENFPIYGR